MPDPSLSAAIKEAYAVAPSDVVILDTLEIRHPQFSQPVRVVRNFADTRTWADLGGADVAAVLDAMEDNERNLVGLVAKLEDSAPENAGEFVSFTAMAFELDLPEIDTTPVPEATLTMDNVGQEVIKNLDAAIVTQDLIEVIYRPYLSTNIDGPEMDPPLTLTLSEVEVSTLRITGRARLLDIGNRAFPSRLYTAVEFPGLAQ